MTQLVNKVLPVAINRANSFDGQWKKEVKAGYVGVLAFFMLRCGLGRRCSADG
jgi:hypothetical protein